MKKGDFLAFSFFKKSRWISAAMALIFLLNVCAPAWAREGNHGSSTALKSFASGSLVGALTAVSCVISPVAGVIGSAAGDITGFAMYYYSYESYGKTWIKIGKMEISKGQVCSMIAGIVAVSAANFAAGTLEKSGEKVAEEAIGEAGSAAGTTASSAAGTVAEGAVKITAEELAKIGATEMAKITAREAAKTAAEEVAKTAALSATPGLFSSVVNSVISLPVNIVKSFVQFFKDFAIKNLFANLGKALWNDFVVKIANGFWKTCTDVFKFITHPKQFIKDAWKRLMDRRVSMTANPYYRYGQTGDIGKALKTLGRDLFMGTVRMVTSEYIKQNLEEGVYIRGKKRIGSLDETIAAMIGNTVSDYVCAGIYGALTHVLGTVDNQGGFLDTGEVDPNAKVKIKSGKKVKNVTVSEVYEAAKDEKTGVSKIVKEEKYTITKDNGDTVTVAGKELIDNNPKLNSQLEAFGKGLADYHNMVENGGNIVAKGDTNATSNEYKTLEECQKEYGLRSNGTKLVLGQVKEGQRLEDGQLIVGEDGESITINLKESRVDSGRVKLVITNKHLKVTAQELSNSGVTGDKEGTFKVRLNDKSIVTITVDNQNSQAIKKAVGGYNDAMDGYARAFGQYGVLSRADPNLNIGVTGTKNDGKTKVNLTIGELAAHPNLIRDIRSNRPLKTSYEFALKNGEKVYVSAGDLSGVIGDLKNYHVMLNSTCYSRLFDTTGGLMYNIKGQDMNTQGALRAGFEAVRNMGLAPLVSTATRIALLQAMDYRTHYSNNKSRIYENAWKMAVAGAGANLVTDTINNLDRVQEVIYGLDRGENPFATRGGSSFGLHVAARVLEEAGAALSQIGWSNYLKKNNLNSDVVNEMGHLLGSSLVAGSIDALFKQDKGLVETNDNERITLDESQRDEMINARLSWDNIGDSSSRFTRGVVRDYKNQLVEAGLDSVLLPFPLRSPGTGPNAFMNQWMVQDKFIQQVSSISQGASPVDADAMRLSSNLSYRADTGLAESFSSAIANSFRPLDLHSYASFGDKGITDYYVNRSLIQRIDLKNNPDVKEAFKNYVEELKANAQKDEDEGRLLEAAGNRARALELENAVEKGKYVSVRSTYRPSRAGVAQDQFTYGNSMIASGVLEGLSQNVGVASLRGVNEAVGKQSSYKMTLEEAKERLPFIYKTIVPDDSEITGDNNITEAQRQRFDTLVNQLNQEVKLYSPQISLLDYTTVDQFGRLQNTYYYGAEFDGSSWQSAKLDKSTQHFYGPFGHQLSATKDHLEVKPQLPQSEQKLSSGYISGLTEYWDNLAGDFSTAVKIKPVDLAKKLGFITELAGNESPEELRNKFVDYVKGRLNGGDTAVIEEIARSVDNIANDSKTDPVRKNIGANFESFIPKGKFATVDGKRTFILNKSSDVFKRALPEAQKNLLEGGTIAIEQDKNVTVVAALPLSKEEGLRLVSRLNETYIDQGNKQRVYGEDIEKLTKDTWKKSGKTQNETLYTILYAYMMFTPQADGRQWKELSPEEKHNVLYGVTGWRLATAPLYERDGVKQTLERNPSTTNVLYMGSGADRVDLNKVETIYVPGIVTPGNEIKAPAPLLGKPVYEKVVTPRSPERDSNYSYDLSLYPVGRASSPYAGPQYQVSAYEINTDPVMQKRGVEQAQGVNLGQYIKFVGRSASGVSAFSDQTVLPKWSIDTEFGKDDDLTSVVPKNYYYDADRIAKEVGSKFDRDSYRNNKSEAKLLESVKLHGIKDVTGKEFFFVTADMDKGDELDYYGAFYKIDNEFDSFQKSFTKEEQARLDTIENEQQLGQFVNLHPFDDIFEAALRKAANQKEAADIIEAAPLKKVWASNSDIGTDPLLLKSGFKPRAVRTQDVIYMEEYQKSAYPEHPIRVGNDKYSLTGLSKEDEYNLIGSSREQIMDNTLYTLSTLY